MCIYNTYMYIHIHIYMYMCVCVCVCPGERHGNPLHYSCLENPMDRGVWWATVHRVILSQTQ